MEAPPGSQVAVVVLLRHSQLVAGYGVPYTLYSGTTCAHMHMRRRPDVQLNLPDLTGFTPPGRDARRAAKVLELRYGFYSGSAP